ncbi:hypothetical protein A3L09_00880 [Thermococcus profundus]|uniref:Uncharacterized protein n=1 Tax=Thermococcus profundus TaxID=49899 RepID=A0A2Z2MD68_THEPR|nr:hypothetical protein [Thermococcus profundus]ASJ01914.1 hypothetical protein A3L09_00880 [Thermococcus profundus]
MILEKLLAAILLTMFLGISAAVKVMGTIMRAGSAVWRKALRVEIPENEKKSWEKVHTAVWLLIGIWAFWRLKSSTLLGAVFGFLSFRSGSNVSKTAVYALHDRNILKRYSEGDRLLSVVGIASAFSLLMEGIFVLSFATAYRILSATAGPTTTAGSFIIYLWIGGFLFGAVFAWLVSRDNEGVILKNEAPVVLFFTTLSGKRKAEEGIKKSKKIAKKPIEHLRRKE